MGRTDPFTGYSIVLRAIIWGVVPLFTAYQSIRLKRALHVFQLEGYKRKRFLEWCRSNPERARFLTKTSGKKPLVMTGRAWRILVASIALILVAVLVLPGVAHLAGGAPWDLLTWAVMTAATFFFLPRVLVAGDVVVSPIQKMVNNRYLRAASARLEEVSPLVVGVTGSFGKTSTKFAIEGLVGPRGSVLATPGSFNTPLGVCRTINERLQRTHGYFVVEMGAYREGDIEELCAFVKPSIGVLTAIGPAHLERFGSLEAIGRAKYEIVLSLPSEGVAVMNVDDEVVRQLADTTTNVRVIRYGIDPHGRPDVTATGIEVTQEGTQMTISANDEQIVARTRLVGRHAIGHVLSAVAVATAAGRRLTELVEPIASLGPVEHRLQIIEGTGGVTVIDDAYNSNPEGAAAALEVLDAMPGAKKVVVTPGIVELGDLQAEANEAFGRHAGEVADVVVVVARVNRDAIVSGAASGSAEVVVVDTLDEATSRLQTILGPGDVVLFENDLPDQYEG